MHNAKAIRPLGFVRCTGGCKSSSMRPALLLNLALLCAALGVNPASAAPPIRFSGELGGLVTDVAGKPQPGAIVLLFNKEDRLLHQIRDGPLGTFAFGESAARPVFRAGVAHQFRARDEGSHPDQAGHAQSSRRQSFARVQFGAAGFDRALCRRPDERQLEMDSARRQFAAPRSALSAGPAENATSMTSRRLARLSSPIRAAWSEFRPATAPPYPATAKPTSAPSSPSRLPSMAATIFGWRETSDMPPAPAPHRPPIRTTYSRELPAGDTPEISVTMRQIYIPMRVGQNLNAGVPRATARSRLCGPSV